MMKYWYFQNVLSRIVGGRIPMLDGYDEGDPLKLVFSGEAATKDHVWALHNRDNRPRRTEIRSMTVGDVVVVQSPAGSLQAWAVDRVGWKEVQVNAQMLADTQPL